MVRPHSNRVIGFKLILFLSSCNHSTTFEVGQGQQPSRMRGDNRIHDVGIIHQNSINTPFHDLTPYSLFVTLENMILGESKRGFHIL